jgi:hypothetical protein
MYALLILQIPKDLSLLVIVMVVVAVDILIIFTGTAVPSSHLRAVRIEDLQHPMSFVSPAWDFAFGVGMCMVPGASVPFWNMFHVCLWNKFWTTVNSIHAIS